MTVQDQKVKRQYQSDRNLNARIALHARFSTNPYSWQRWIFDHLLQELPDQARVLELGCGPANLWTANRDRIPAGWKIMLSDFSEGMVRTARTNVQSLERPLTLIVGDAQAFPFDDQPFDAILGNHMLYHVPDRPRALREIARSLSQGDGRLFASTVGRHHMHELWALVAPHIKDIHERTRRVSHGFTLENGGEQLAQYFHDVVRYDFDDNLDVTEVDPVIAYLQSSTTLMDCDLDDAVIADIREIVGTEIAGQGRFHIHKASGLFIARHPRDPSQPAMPCL